MTLSAVFLAVVVALLLVLLVGQRSLMYFPIGHVPTPATIGMPDIEPVTFETRDGLTLGGWFFAVTGTTPRTPVLVFSGNAGNRSHRVLLAAALGRQGLQVLLVDYRGYGGNPGSPSEAGLAADARAARLYLIGRGDVDPARLVYFGESLGAAVAVDLSAEHPPAALILRSPFTSMGDVAAYHYPWLPVRWLLRDRYPAVDTLRQVRSPLLVLAGERDRIVPLEHSRRLYEAAGEPKTFVSLPGADHNDMDLLASDAMIDAIVRFLGASLDEWTNSDADI